MLCQQRCGARNEQVATAARERGSVRAMLRTQNMLQALLRSTRERAACFFQQSCLLPRLGSAVPFPCRSWPTTSPAAPSSWPRPLCAVRCAAPSAPRAAPLDARLALDAARHALRRARRAAPTSTCPLACAPTRTRDHTRPPPAHPCARAPPCREQPPTPPSYDISGTKNAPGQQGSSAARSAWPCHEQLATRPARRRRRWCSVYSVVRVLTQ